MGARLRAAGGVAGAPQIAEADYVVVAPAGEAGLPIRAGKVGLFIPNLIGKRVASGDRLIARVAGAGILTARIVQTQPPGPVMIDAGTILLVDRRCRPHTPCACHRRSAGILSWV